MWQAAFERDVIRRATKVSLVVGIILGAINHGDAIIDGQLTAKRFWQIGLTFIVPYLVSTYSSVAAKRDSALKEAGNR
ncbi:MAG: nitrate/nitrite transporter NrtS [Pseudomonadota bacterium]